MANSMLLKPASGFLILFLIALAVITVALPFVLRYPALENPINATLAIGLVVFSIIDNNLLYKPGLKSSKQYDNSEERK